MGAKAAPARSRPEPQSLPLTEGSVDAHLTRLSPAVTAEVKMKIDIRYCGT